MTESEKEIERVIREIKYQRQMKKKRLYESARRTQRKAVAASKKVD